MISNPFLWLILTVIDLYFWVVLIGVILSWLISFNVVNTSNRFIYMVGEITFRLTEPALRPIRRFLPNLGGIDISPLVLIIGIQFTKQIVVWGFINLGLS